MKSKVVFDMNVSNYRLVVVHLSVKDLKSLKSKALKILKENERGEEEDVFWPSVEDVEVALLLSKILHLDCSPFEEPGYGLPEFSIYYNEDARSFCGRWGYDGYPPLDESGLFFGLVDEEEAQKEIAKIIQSFEEKYDKIAYAIIKL